MKYTYINPFPFTLPVRVSIAIIFAQIVAVLVPLSPWFYEALSIAISLLPIIVIAHYFITNKDVQ